MRGMRGVWGVWVVWVVWGEGYCEDFHHARLYEVHLVGQ
jgi:hypothetical protein